MKKYFAVSDVHSFTDRMLTALHEAGFEKDNEEHFVIICGDAFDRGDHSDSMLRWMQNMHERKRLIYIRGNHEDLLEKCVYSIRRMMDIGSHHISNGTVKTLATIVGCTEYDIICRSFEWGVFDAAVNELLDFMKTSVDYFQLGNTLFVHGWVPLTLNTDRAVIVHENYRNGDWNESRWFNGMEQFKLKHVPKDVTTVVCGHWHTSWGWCNIKHQGSEWSSNAKFDALIHYDENLKSRIVALDACTAYTGKVNCVVFDEDGIIIDKNYSI